MADTIIPNVVVSMPSQLFTLARSFKAAANGRIYIGKIDTDPTIPENQIQVYLQNEDGSTVPISQPIMLNSAGFPVYLGQIAKVVTVEGHSMAIYDSYGVEQFYFPNVLKYDPDMLKQYLSGSDGLKYVGRCGSVNALRQIPGVSGQKIDLSRYSNDINIGEGYLEWVDDTTTADDGGMFFRVTSQGGWRRISTEVNTEFYGLQRQTRTTSGMIDQTDKLQAAANYARDNGLYLNAQYPAFIGSTDSMKGFFIKKPLDLTGVMGTKGVLSIFVDGNTFTDPSGFNFAVQIRNAQFNGTTIVGNTTRGNIDINWIETRNINRRSGTVKGILFVAARSTVSKLRANSFSGRGVWAATSYDSNIQRIESEWCGNINEWAVDAAFYTPSTGFADETNGLTIGAILCHNCTDRIWRCYGSKIRLENVHEEASYCLNKPAVPSAQDLRTSLGYINSYFSSIGGSVGSISIQPDASSTLDHVLAIGFVGTSVGNTYTPGTTVIMNGDPGQRGGAIGDIYTKDLYIIDQARTTISHVEVAGTLYNRAVRNDSPILGGFITNVAENVGDIHNVTFRNPVTYQPAFAHTLYGCTFNGAFLSNSSARVTAFNCIYNTALTTINDTKMGFLNCFFNAGIVVAGSTLDIIFKGGQITGNLSFSAPGGSWLFTDPPRIVGSVVGWVWPLGTAPTGSRTRHPAPMAVGDTVERTYNGSAWVTTQKVL